MQSALIVTALPAFYKINLFNEIAASRPIEVIFLRESERGRGDDFTQGDMHFPHTTLPAVGVVRVWRLIRMMKRSHADSMILSGWNALPYWVAAFISPKCKNACIVESGDLESGATGVKRWLKRLFLSRISTLYVSGGPHRRLALSLGFRGNIITTRGVGLISCTTLPHYTPREEVADFLFVGRLTEVKNVDSLIRVFRNLPRLRLHIAGMGELEERLKACAGSNVIFHGQVEQSRLRELYMAYDALILPSVSEPWGIVVEEALACGMPVIVSSNVGCAEDIVGSDYGLIFPNGDEAALKGAVERMCDKEYHNTLRRNIAGRDIAEMRRQQIESYLL